MTPAQLLQWVQVGSQLIVALGVPVAKVIAFVREQGVPDEQLALLETQWTALIRQIEDRLAAARAAGGQQP